MNSFHSKETVENLRKQYMTGCCVRLVRMDDIQVPAVRTEGTVFGIDDAGSILNWDNGSSLSVVYDVDLCEKTAQRSR